MRIDVWYLGVPKVAINGKERHIQQKKLFALLIYILYHSRCTREELMSIFWCDASEESARQNLRNGLHRLKKLLGEEVICTQGNHIVEVQPQAIVTRDTDLLVAEGGGISLLSLKSFTFLDKLNLSNTPEFEKWTDSMRAVYERIAVERLESNMRESVHTGEAAEQYAQKLLSLSPYHEEACCTLLQYYGDNGRYSDAIQLYTSFSTQLQEDLGLEPQAETKRLYLAVVETRNFHAQNRHPRIASPAHEKTTNKLLSEFRSFSAGLDYQHCIIQGNMGTGKSQVIREFLALINPDDCHLLPVKFEVANADIPYYAIGKILLLLAPCCGMKLAEPNYSDMDTIKLYHIISLEKVISRLKHRNERILLHLENMEAMDHRSMDILLTHLLDKNWGQVFIVGEYCNNFSSGQDTLLRLNPLDNVALWTLAPLDRQASISYLFQQLPDAVGQNLDLQGIPLHTGGILMLLENVAENIRNQNTNLYALSDATLNMLSILLSSLNPEERDCIELLSVFRNGVEPSILSAINRKNPVDVVAVIDCLQQRQLVKEETFESHLLAQIRPTMIRDVFYDRMSRLRRKELHRLAAQLYQELDDGHRRDYFYLRELKYHFEQAGCWYELVYYALMELWYRLDYCDEFFPTIKSNPEVLDTLYISKNETYKEFIRFAEQLDQLNDSLSPEQNCELSMILDYLKGRTLTRDSRGSEGIQYIRRMIEAAGQLERDDMLLKGYLEVVFHGVKAENEPLMRQYIGMARGIQTFPQYLNEKGILLRLEALCDIMVGQYESAERLLQESIQVLESPRLKGYSYINVAAAYDYLGLIYRRQQNYSCARNCLEQAITLCLEKNVKKSLDLFYEDLGYTLFLQGDYESAKDVFQKSAQYYAMFDNYWLRSVGESCMAIISVADWEPEKALEHYRRAEIYAKKDRTKDDLNILEQAHKTLEQAGII